MVDLRYLFNTKQAGSMDFWKKTELIPELLLTIALTAAALFIAHLIFHRARKTVNSLHVRFLDRALQLIIYVICICRIIGLYFPSLNLNRVLLSGSALIVGIVGFAAQPVISDLICGYLISVNKPFEIGDRIIVEGLEPGIVEDITLRHAVLRIYDDIRIIVPNSQLNAKTITNTSYKHENRGVHLQYAVSYDTNIQQAMDIIRDCVAESPYTLGIENNGISEDSSPVYFLRYSDSALILETTIHVRPAVSTYIATTDVNMRVFRAFGQNQIEIPYTYINMISQDPDRKPAERQDRPAREKKSKYPSKRLFRTDTIQLYGVQDPFTPVTATARKFAEKQGLSDKETYFLQLLSEEALTILRDLLKETRSSFFIEGSGQMYRIHLNIPVGVDMETYRTLLSLSSSGKNEAGDLGTRIREILLSGFDYLRNIGAGEDEQYDWNMNDLNEDRLDSLSKSILTAHAHDIRVSVRKDRAELIITRHISKV